METIYNVIGRRIRAQRERLGLTQADLARILSARSGESRYSVSLLSAIESGVRRIHLEDLPLFAEVLQVSPGYLLSGTPLRTPDESEVRYVLLRATMYLHPDAKRDIEAFAREVEQMPAAPPAAIRTDPSMPAEDLLNKAGITRPPVDPFMIAQKVGLPVYERDFEEEISGVLVIVGDRRAIGVNTRHAEVHRRFSVAHEVAHFIKGHRTAVDIDVNDRQLFGETGANPTEEREANAFAAELLMPRKWVRNHFAHVSSDHEELARLYNVSKQAMWYRLVNLGLVTDFDFVGV